MVNAFISLYAYADAAARRYCNVSRSCAAENLKKPESIFARENLNISEHAPRFA